MRPLKTAERSATVSFCQNGPYLAAGSVAGAIDLSFSTASQLEIFALDFANTSSDLPLAGGAVQAPERFSRLCWGPPGLDPKLYPFGLLGGGLADGSICIWNPARIVGHSAQEASKGTLLCRLQKHQGAVKGLEFNSFSPNLLASGGVDGDLCIWDVGNPAQPSLYPAMKGGASAGTLPEITYLAWNKKVQHILATCTGAGTVVVWDLKKQRPVISFKDPSGRKRCSVVQWNPEVATQLMVASDDDMSPSLQLWDLRNSVSPIKEFHGHAKGVLGLSWCPQDASFVLSTAKDNRTICWDVATAEVYCELAGSNNWNFDVQWAPGELRGVFATATFEGQLGISSLSACTAPGADGEASFSYGDSAVSSAVAKAKAPAWLRRPCAAAFGFGGRLAVIANSRRQLPTGEVAETGSIAIQQVMAEPSLVQQSEQFEAAIHGGDRDVLRAFCAAKERQLGGSEEGETWAFLQTHFEGDGRRYLLQRLGFEDVLPPLEEPPAPEAEGEVSGAQGAEAAAAGVEALALDAPQQEQEAAAALIGDGSEFFDDQQGAESFFDGLAANTPPGMSPKEVDGILAGSAGGRPASGTQTPRTPKDRPVIDGPPGEGEQEIQRALFVGNYTGAVEACLKVSRHADALIVASLVGGEAFERARKEYMFATPHPYMRMVHAFLGNDWQGFIKARPHQAWRETLACILTSAPYDQFEALVSGLAHKLATAGMHHAATLCYVTSGDVDAAVREWAKSAVGPAAPVETLEALMEKAVVLGLGVSKQSASDALSGLIVRYAELLAANGRLGMALDYLDMVPGEASTGVAILKDRIFRGGGAAQTSHAVMQPPFPFVAEEVVPAPQQPTQQPQQQAAYGGYAQQASMAQQGYGAAAAAQQGYGAAAAAATAAAAGGYGGYGAKPGSVQQAANGYSNNYGGYGAQQQQQPAQSYATYGGGGYGSAPPSQPPAAAAPVYQPQAPRSTGYTAPTQVYQAAAAPQPPQQPPAVFAPAAAPPQPQVFQPAAAPPAAAPPPQVYQPGAGAALPSPTMSAPAPVYQPAAAPQVPQVYQQPTAAAAFAPQRAGSLSAGMAQPAASFVPQQGPSPTAGGTATAAAAFGPPPGQMQPGAPVAAPKPQPPPAPAGPPANITLATADTSKVAPELRPIVNTLLALHQACEAAAGANPAKRRELEDSSRKLGALLWKLNEGQVSQSVSSKLLQLCAALDAGDYAMATHVQVSLTTSDWDEASAWLTALKRLIKTRQMLG